MLTTTTPATLARSSSTTTAGDALGAFLANKRSANTRRAYAADLGAFARYLGAADQAEAARVVLAADVAAVVAWRDAMIADGCAPSTVARRLAAARTFYTFARAVGAVERNPAELVEAPRVEAARQRAPHVEAAGARRLLDSPDTSTVRGLRDRAILGLLACSGLRRAEVAGLRAGDVKCSPVGVTATVDGKGGKVRTVDVDRATAAALLAYLAAAGRPLDQAEASAPMFRGIGPHAGASGIALDTVDHLVRAHAARAGVEAVGGAVAPHALRRTFATVALDRGASLEALRRTMGHADPRTTARYDRRREASVTVAY